LGLETYKGEITHFKQYSIGLLFHFKNCGWTCSRNREQIDNFNRKYRMCAKFPFCLPFTLKKTQKGYLTTIFLKPKLLGLALYRNIYAKKCKKLSKNICLW